MRIAVPPFRENVEMILTLGRSERSGRELPLELEDRRAPVVGTRKSVLALLFGELLAGDLSDSFEESHPKEHDPWNHSRLERFVLPGEEVLFGLVLAELQVRARRALERAFEELPQHRDRDPFGREARSRVRDDGRLPRGSHSE